MKRWALLVVVLYAVALCVLAWPLLIAAFGVNDVGEFLKDILDPQGWIGIWICAATLALLQAALLVVPVRVASRRPVSKRWIFWPILAAIVAMLLLGAGMVVSVMETLHHTEWLKDYVEWGAIIVGAFWVVWAFIFGFYSGIAGPQNFMARLCKVLVAGSILELLVAIPAHVIARVRGYCCAGLATGCGLAAGIAVALLAFGPAVFVLIVRRYASLKPPEHLAADPPAQPLPPSQKKDS
jgi:hypothetical protein